MKNQITVRNSQSLFDIAIQTTGIASNAFLIAQENGITPTDNLTVGSTLTIPDEVTTDVTIQNYYSQQNILPATSLTQSEQDIIIGVQGIGYWVIGSNFKVINADTIDSDS